LLDYGLLKEWEAVKGLCLERDEGSYHYKFCFFKEIKQGSILLGRFSGWGAREEVIMQETSRRKGSKRSKEKLLETELVADGFNSFGLSSVDPIGLDRSSQPAKTNNYTTQVSSPRWCSIFSRLFRSYHFSRFFFPTSHPID